MTAVFNKFTRRLLFLLVLTASVGGFFLIFEMFSRLLSSGPADLLAVVAPEGQTSGIPNGTGLITFSIPLVGAALCGGVLYLSYRRWGLPEQRVLRWSILFGCGAAVTFLVIGLYAASSGVFGREVPYDQHHVDPSGVQPGWLLALAGLLLVTAIAAIMRPRGLGVLLLLWLPVVWLVTVLLFGLSGASGLSGLRLFEQVGQAQVSTAYAKAVDKHRKGDDFAADSQALSVEDHVTQWMTGDGRSRLAAMESLRKAGATLILLETGGIVVAQGGVRWWLPGVTTRQLEAVGHIPVFEVTGAKHTRLLRTATADVYQDGRWVQRDSETLDYESPRSDVPELVRALAAGVSEDPVTMPEWRDDSSQTARSDSEPEAIYTERLSVSPRASRFIPAGAVPISLHTEEIGTTGSLRPISATFSTKKPVRTFSWVSSVPTFSERQLALASPSSDPAHTHLPDGLPSRIRQLALKITTGHESPYEKAKAIERYLSSEYIYGFADPSGRGRVPEERDPVDWFLFDHQVGTSGSFSSAFVVLCRSVGIPARVVSGWVVGQVGVTQTVFADQAHQWAEVAFNGLGWVAFEPTPEGAPSRTPILVRERKLQLGEPTVVRLAAPTLEGLVVSLSDGNPRVRLASAEALGRLTRPEAIGPLAQAALLDEDARVRRAAVEALGRLAESHPLSFAIWVDMALSDQNPIVRASALKLVVDALGDEEPSVRGKALTTLGEWGDTDAIGPVVKSTLFDGNADVRQAASAALRRIAARHPSALDHLAEVALFHGNETALASALALLLEAAGEEEPGVRSAAATAMAQLGDPEATNMLVSMALFDEDAIVRQAGAEALGKLGPTWALPLLLPFLQDPEDTSSEELRSLRPENVSSSRGDYSLERQDAVIAVGHLGGLAAIDPLVRTALRDDDIAVRQAAAVALGMFRHERALELLLAGIRNDAPSVRTAAADALGRLGDAAGAVVHRRNVLFKAAVFDSHEEVRQAARGGMFRLGRVEALKTLLEELGRDHRLVRKRVAEMLAELGEPIAIGPLVQVALYDEDMEVRETAVTSLAKLDQAAALERLLQVLDEEAARARIAASEALALLGDPGAIDPLLRVVLLDEDADVRQAAVLALAKLGTSTILERIVSALNDDESRIRIAAAEALGRIGDVSVLEPLGQVALLDVDGDVRLAAVVALGSLEYPRASEFLVEVLRDKDPRVRLAAVAGLDGRDFRPAITSLAHVALFDEDQDVRVAGGRILLQLAEEYDETFARVAEAALAGDDGARARARTLLLEALSHDGPRVRRAAVRALEALGHPEVLAPLVQAALFDEDASVRGVAGEVLRALAREMPEALILLVEAALFDGGSKIRDYAAAVVVEALNDPEPLVRLTAIEALNKLEHQGAIGPMVRVALADNLIEVRHAAVDALRTLGPATAVPLLARALADEDLYVRRAGVSALWRLGHPDAIDHLASVSLFDEDDGIRSTAIAALWDLGIERAVEVAASFLSDEAPDVRMDAVEALRDLGHSSAVDHLVPVVLFDENPEIRRAAIAALRELGRARAVELLSEALDHGDPDVRRAALEALGELAYPGSTDHLVHVALFDEDGETRQAAIAALRKVGGERAVDLLEKALEDDDRDVRLAAVQALEGLGNPDVIGPLLRAAVFDRDGGVRRAADEALRKLALEDHSTFAALTKAALALGPTAKAYAAGLLLGVLNEGVPAARREAIEALGELGTPEVVEPLLQAALFDEDDGVRQVAREALSGLVSEDPGVLTRLVEAALATGPTARAYAAELLLTVLDDEDPNVRTAAIEGLARLGNAGAIDRLVPVALFDEDGGTRQAAVAALRKLGSARALGLLVKALGNEDPDVRRAAVEALAGLGNPDAIEHLVPVALSDEDEGTRKAAITAFRRLGTSRAEELLAEALVDEDEDMRRAAVGVLEEIGADVQTLENGGSLVKIGRLGYWVPGTTTAQSSGLPTTPIFEIRGAAHTGRLRSATGDVYENGRWIQLDPVELKYDPPAEVPSMVRNEIDRTGSPLSSMPRDRLDSSLLAQFETRPDQTFTDVIHMTPLGESIPAGIMPTSQYLQEVSIPGDFKPYSATFFSEDQVEEYSWTSVVPRYSQEQLSRATVSSDSTYIQLPDGLPSRIRELAIEITKGHSSAYEKAKAIETYLSTQYSYRLADSTDDLPSRGRDPVDWFLFDHREGTCGVFSSAFVVLARSVGIPARVVSGWAIAPTGGTQIVRASQGHQWAEVAFDGLGWVEFEPTGPGGAPSRATDGGDDGGDGGGGGDDSGDDGGDGGGGGDGAGGRGESEDDAAVRELVEALSDQSASVRDAAKEALEEIGATVQTLENGGSLAKVGKLGYWVPGTTTAQASELPTTPIFRIRGAAHTGRLRTATGDVYRNGYWVQLDPVKLRYEPPTGVPDMVRGEINRSGSSLSSMPSYRLNLALLAQFETPPDQRSTDVIYMTPLEGSIPAGTMPTSQYLHRVSIPGEFSPYSATFYSEESVTEYSWTSVVPRFSQQQLRGAIVSSDPTYTQLPDGLPSRIRDLAIEITRGRSSAYDKAKAIETYLSTRYPYRFADSADDHPPPGRDPVDWFLFDHREGTCGVFSSAFVVLARSVGIPARTVSGWAIAPAAETQIVRADQGHQWAEVAFDGIGWIEFEPTASGGAPSRILSDDSVEEEESDTPPEPVLLDTVVEITEWPEEARKGLPFAIGGTVQTKSGAPVSGLEVEVFINENKEHGGTRLGTATATQGRFVMEVTVPTKFEGGDYQLIAHAIGNDKYKESWSDPGISIYSGTEFELTGPSEVPVDTEAAFSGKLFEETGAFVVGHEIRIKVDDVALPDTATDSQGRFGFTTTFDTPGRHKIEVAFDKSEFLLGNVATLPIDVTLPTEMDIEVPGLVGVAEEFTVTGTLLDIRGEPVAGKNVKLRIGDAVSDIVTDSDGRFQDSHVFDRIGNYNVAAAFESDGYILPSSAQSNVAATLTTELVLEAPGQVGVGEEFAVTGTLLDIQGEPMAGRNIKLRIAGTVSDIATDPEGRFQASHAFDRVGNYIVAAAFRSDGPILPSSTQARVVVTLPTELVIDVPGQVGVGEKFLVDGTLLDIRGRPVTGRNVNLRIGDMARDLATDSEGRFQASHVFDSTGEYTVAAVFKSDGHVLPSSTQAKVEVALPTEIVMEVPIQVASSEEFEVAGTLLGIRGQPVPGKTVVLQIGDVTSEVETASNGRFRADHVFDIPGDYQVAAVFEGDGPVLLSSARSQVAVRDVPRLILWGPNRIRVGEAATFGGEITSATSSAVAGAILTINGSTGNLATAVMADDSGRFEFQHSFSETGRGTVSATLPAGDYWTSATNNLSFSVVEPTSFALEGTRMVPLGHGYLLEGVLETRDGQPVAGKPVAIEIDGRLDTTLTTGPDGSFSWEKTFVQEMEATVSARFGGSEIFDSTLGSVSVNVGIPAVVVEPPAPVTRGDSLTLRGVVVVGSQVATDVDVTIDGENAARTNPVGIFVVRYPVLPDAKPGPFTLEVATPSLDASAEVMAEINSVTTLTIDAPGLVPVGREVLLKGEIEDDQGEPLEAKSVRLEIGEQREVLLETDPMGAFEFAYTVDRPGDYAIVAEFPGDGPVLPSMARTRLSARYPTALVLRGPGEIGRGENGLITGEVISNAGSPVSTITLRIEDSRGGLIATAKPDGNGRFELQHSFVETGQSTLIASVPDGEIWLPSSNRLTVTVVEPTSIMVQGPRTALIGKPYRITGTLRGPNDEPIFGESVTIEVDGSPRVTLTTGTDGSFGWETRFNSEAESTVTANFAGTVHLAPDQAALRLTAGAPSVVVETPEPIARGDTLTIRGLVAVGSELMPNVDITIDGVKAALSNHAGAFVVRRPIPADAPLGRHEIEVAAEGLGVSTSVPFQVKSSPSLIVVAANKVELGQPLLLRAVLVDDRGSAIPYAALRYGSESVTTDASGEASVALDAPEDETVSVIPVTVVFDGNETHFPTTYSTYLPIFPVPFNWLPWVGLPLLLLIGTAVSYWVGRRGSTRVAVAEPSPTTAPVPQLPATPTVEIPAGPQEPALHVAAEPVKEPVATYVEIDFLKPAEDLPDVWEVGDVVQVTLALSDDEERSVGDAAIAVTVSGSKKPLYLVLDADGTCSLSLDANAKGTYEVTASYPGAEDEYLPSSAQREYRVVDCREEVVRLYNSFIDWAAQRVPTVTEQSTPREVEVMVSTSGIPVDDRALEEIVARFEEADYSEHEITWQKYEAMYRAWHAIVEEPPGR